MQLFHENKIQEEEPSWGAQWPVFVGTSQAIWRNIEALGRDWGGEIFCGWCFRIWNCVRVPLLAPPAKVANKNYLMGHRAIRLWGNTAAAIDNHRRLRFFIVRSFRHISRVYRGVIKCCARRQSKQQGGSLNVCGPWVCYVTNVVRIWSSGDGVNIAPGAFAGATYSITWPLTSRWVNWESWARYSAKYCQSCLRRGSHHYNPVIIFHRMFR